MASAEASDAAEAAGVASAAPGEQVQVQPKVQAEQGKNDTLEHHVRAAVRHLRALKPQNRPATQNGLENELKRTGSCNLRIEGLVTPAALVKALVPELETSPEKLRFVRSLALAAQAAFPQDDGALVQEAAKRVAKRMQGLPEETLGRWQRRRAEVVTWIGAQALEQSRARIEPRELVAELLRRGLVSQNPETGRLAYAEDRLAEVPALKPSPGRCDTQSWWTDLNNQKVIREVVSSQIAEDTAQGLTGLLPHQIVVTGCTIGASFLGSNRPWLGRFQKHLQCDLTFDKKKDTIIAKPKTGADTSKMLAEEEIRELLLLLARSGGSLPYQLKVDEKTAGTVIGRRGRNVRNIECSTGCRVDIYKVSPKAPSGTLIGWPTMGTVERLSGDSEVFQTGIAKKLKENIQEVASKVSAQVEEAIENRRLMLLAKQVQEEDEQVVLKQRRGDERSEAFRKEARRRGHRKEKEARHLRCLTRHKEQGANKHGGRHKGGERLVDC